MKNCWILFLFLTVTTFAQQANLELTVSSDFASVGERLTVTVKSSIGGNINIDFPPEFDQGYSVVNGMKQEMDYTSGRFVSLYYLSKDGSFKKTGTFTIGPATISRGGKILKSNTVTVTVETGSPTNSSGNNSNPSSDSPSASKSNKQAAYGLIGLSKNKVYEGEPLIARSYIYARFRPTHLDSYKTYEMKDVMDAHSLSSGNQINLEQKKVSGELLFVFSMDPKLVFPVKTGEHTIEPFHLELMSGFRAFPFNSNSPTYQVIPLPIKSPFSFKGGVGDFSISRNISSVKQKQGDVVQLVVKVNGVGNVHLLQEPNISLPESIQIYGDPIIKENYTFGNKGAEGSITYTYNIQLLDSGKVEIPQMSYAYFDLKKEEYVVLKNKSILLSIDGDPNFELITDLYKTDTNLVEINDDILSDLPASNSSNIYVSKINYILVSFLLFVILLLLYFLYRKRLNDKEEAEEHLILKKSEDRDLNNGFTYISISDSIKEIDELFENGDHEQLYDLIQMTLVILLKNSLKVNHKELIAFSILLEKLKEHHFDSIFIGLVTNIYNVCETARYGMPLNNEEREELYHSFKIVLSTKDKMN